MMKKRFLAISMASVMLFATACGASDSKNSSSGTEVPETTTLAETSAEKNEPVTIDFWHAMSGGTQDALVALTDKFNSENGKGITVNLVNQGAYGDLSTKLMASVPAKTLPDLSQVYNSWIENYLDSVVKLDDLVASDFDDYDDILESYRDESEEFGSIYTLPFNKSSQVFFYNKTKFTELNISAPKTWDELKSVAKTIYDATGKPLYGYDDLTALFQQLIMQNGSEFIKDGHVMFNNDKGIEGFALFTDMYKSGQARVAGEDKYLSGPFGNQDVFAYVGSSAGAAYIKANGFEYGAAPLPKGIKGAVPQAGTNLAIFTQDSARQKAAWEYVKFLTGTEATTEWAIKTGYLPIRESAFQSDDYQAFMSTSEVAQAAYAQVSDQYFEKAYPGANEVRTLISTEVEAALLNGTDTKQAVEAIAVKVQEVLDANK